MVLESELNLNFIPTGNNTTNLFIKSRISSGIPAGIDTSGKFILGIENGNPRPGIPGGGHGGAILIELSEGLHTIFYQKKN